MENSKILIIPPLHTGGGPGNAVSRITENFKILDISFTHNIFSFWNVALINVGTGIRVDIARALQFSRRIVYRVDGCYSQKVFDRQDRPWDVKYDKINKRITRFLKFSDFVIYQSNFTKNLLDLLYLRNSDYDIIPNGIDPDIFSPAETKVDRPVTIGCIATFRSNRIQQLLDIAIKIPFKHRFLLAGRMDEQCKYDLSKFNSNRYSHCTLDIRPPVIGDYHLVNLYREIDCFLHPFIGDTCSNSVIEALATGVPVVVPSWGGSSELIGDGGIIINQNPWENYQAYLNEFTEAISTISRKKDYYSSKARLRALNCYNIKKVTDKYLKALFP